MKKLRRLFLFLLWIGIGLLVGAFIGGFLLSLALAVVPNIGKAAFSDLFLVIVAGMAFGGAVACGTLAAAGRLPGCKRR